MVCWGAADLSVLSGPWTLLQANEPNPAMPSHYDELCPLKLGARINSSVVFDHRGQRRHFSLGSIDKVYILIKRYASVLNLYSGHWISGQNSLFAFILFHLMRLGWLQDMNNSL